MFTEQEKLQSAALTSSRGTAQRTSSAALTTESRNEKEIGKKNGSSNRDETIEVEYIPPMDETVT